MCIIINDNYTGKFIFRYCQIQKSSFLLIHNELAWKVFWKKLISILKLVWELIQVFLCDKKC